MNQITMDKVQISNNPVVQAVTQYLDHKIELTYLDAGASDERIETVTWTSKSYGKKGIVATLTYGGAPGAYYLTSVQFSKEA